MPTITAIEEIEEARKRRRIVFADAESVELSLGIALAMGFLPGREVTPSEIRRAVRDDRLKAAEEAALRLLRTKDRSEAELRRELTKRGHSAEMVRATITKCRGWGYLDDKRLAERIVEEGVKAKHLGPARIRQKLRQRGIDEHTAGALQAQAGGERRDLVDRAVSALRPKMRSYARLEPEVARRRMMGFLQRRGFDFGTIKEATERAARELDEHGS